MELDLTGLRIDVTDAIRSFTEKKIQKLNKYFDEGTICHVTFTDKSKGKHRVDIRIEYKSHTYLAEDNTDDLYSGIESLVSKIEGQIRRERTNDQKKRRTGIPEEVPQEETEE